MEFMYISKNTRDIMHLSGNGNMETVGHFGKETNDVTELKKRLTYSL
jgi:hypothetical protein